MKDKRNCNSNNYPIYQQPMIMQPMGYPVNYQTGIPNFNPTISIEQQINNLEQQINLLEQRINRLEKSNTNTNYNKYNDSNYYMV